MGNNKRHSEDIQNAVLQKIVFCKVKQYLSWGERYCFGERKIVSRYGRQSCRGLSPLAVTVLAGRGTYGGVFLLCRVRVVRLTHIGLFIHDNDYYLRYNHYLYYNARYNACAHAKESAFGLCRLLGCLIVRRNNCSLRWEAEGAVLRDKIVYPEFISVYL